jgi:alkylhydroperoxidase family enzyme
MNQIYPQNIKKLLEAFFTRPADTPPELRQSVTAYAARVSGADRPSGDVPDEIAGYIEIVARHAYRVTDEDFLKLKKSGYSENQIFEITLGAALGAGLARLEHGMSALYRFSK